MPRKRTAPKTDRARRTAHSAAAGLAAISRAGEQIASIPVSISYRIIELFSAGLYSSPNKAVEELVSNSYDASATQAQLFLPSNIDAADASIWVVDNGTSMDLEGLFDLWRIASSRKRELAGDRLPIGKFGIGKLATYVLARELTYVCKTADGPLAVTMDYDRIDPSETASTELSLAVRSLSTAELQSVLRPLLAFEGGAAAVDSLLSDSGPTTWTAAILTDLRPAARQLQIGRIRWLLRTALPLSPAFHAELNGQRVESEVGKGELLTSWRLGERAVDLAGIGQAQDGLGPYVTVDGLKGTVRGTVEIYENPLTTGKAAQWGRSHGFFVMVRGRLVNLDDALFGLPALSFATFNRLRIVVSANGLDDFLTSTREAVMDAPPVELFRAYLRAEFNEARTWFDTFEVEKQEQDRIPSRLGRAASSVAARPLVAAVRMLIEDGIPDLALIRRPVGLNSAEATSLVEGLEAAVDAGQNPIESVELRPIAIDDFLTYYEPQFRRVVVNTLHPFFANFIEGSNSAHPFEMIAVAEVLTEAYLLEEHGNADIARRIIQRRDQFLRELVAARREGPAVIAQNLRDKSSHSSGLEEAVADALRSLGFEVVQIGGSGKPDGLAKAVLGVPSDGVADRDDYTLTFDAKSTARRRRSAHGIGVSGPARHRSDYDAQHALVVAPAFEGGAEGSALAKELRSNDVTAITVDDLALLVLVAAKQQLGFRRLRDWLRTCRTPAESAQWVRAQLDTPIDRPPLEEVLSAIAKLQAEGTDAVEIAAVVVVLRDQFGLTLTKSRVSELITGLRSLAPGYVTYAGNFVTLEMSVERVKAEIARHYRQFPESVVDASYIEPLLDAD
ncbi:MAG: ATP-binding protein [Chloroflexi bacterium]|nr:ATP-binding protein [Chloroflexota bacterium]